MADMAYWRPRGELVGTLWEADITGGGGDEFSTVERGIMARSGRRIQLASSEDGRLLITGCMQTVGGPIHAWSCTEVVRHGRGNQSTGLSCLPLSAAWSFYCAYRTRGCPVEEDSLAFEMLSTLPFLASFSRGKGEVDHPLEKRGRQKCIEVSVIVPTTSDIYVYMSLWFSA